MLSEYQLFVLSKASPPRHLPIDSFHLIHSCLGLTTEYLELVLSHSRENTEEELGDFFWYMMLTAHSLNYHLDNLPLELPVKDRPNLTLRNLGNMLENFVSIAKKHVIYGNDQTSVLSKAFYGLWLDFVYHMQSCNYSLELAISENVAKLNQRYSTTFSPEEAAARKDKE